MCNWYPLHRHTLHGSNTPPPLILVILNSPAKKKKTTKYCFQTFSSIEIITHWKYLFVNLSLLASILTLIVSYQQNVKEVCCICCYTEHITFVPAIRRFMKKIDHLKSVWQKNSFPLFCIDKCIHKFLNKLTI